MDSCCLFCVDGFSAHFQHTEPRKINHASSQSLRGHLSLLHGWYLSEADFTDDVFINPAWSLLSLLCNEHTDEDTLLDNERLVVGKDSFVEMWEWTFCGIIARSGIQSTRMHCPCF